MRHKPYRVITKKLSLPLDLVGRVELRLPANVTNTGPAYSAWSQLVEELLRDWVTEQEAVAQSAATTGVIPALPEGSSQ